MLPLRLQTPREVTLYYDSVYDSLIESGQAIPFLYPWCSIGAFVAFVYLLVDHRQSRVLQWLRYPVFTFVLALEIWCLLCTRAKHPAGAFGIGLLSSWGVLWLASLMMFNDSQSDFSRIERYRRDLRASSGSALDRYSANGAPKSCKENGDNTLNVKTGTVAIESSRSNALNWQGYPATLRSRLDWVTDMFCNFRGIGWNWQISSIPPPPKRIESELRGSVDYSHQEEMTESRTGIRRFIDKPELLKYAVKKLIFGYLALDIIKVIMHNDPYFLGYVDAAPPSHLPAYMRGSLILVKCYRLAVGLAALYTLLSQAFNLGPLFFCGLLGSDLIGAKGEAWMNPPDHFGSYRTVLDQGLAGWWGSWWHQTFRFGFESAAAKLLDGLKIDRKSTNGRMISLFVAFFLSGCMHAAGSYTQLGDTRPLMGPMRFFLLQPFGILLQLFLTKLLSDLGVRSRTPKLLRQLANFIYVHVWGYFTAPLLIDDFSKGGVFLFEPIAFSPLRALGLGAKDDTWYCWSNGIFFWRSGKTWWDTGITL